MAFNRETAAEIKFLKGLGTYSEHGTAAHQAGREKLLRGYLKAAKVRDNWGRMNRAEIIHFVENELRHY